MIKDHHFFEACVRVGDDLWFSAAKENALCRKNLTTGKLEIVYQFQHASPRESCLHSRVFYDRGILYLVPANANAFAVYRIEEHTCRYLDLPKLHVYGINEGVLFYHYESAVQIGRRIYMVSLLSPEITVFDMDTETMETVYIKELDSQNRAWHHTFGCDAAVWAGKLYLTVYGTAKLLVLHTADYSYQFLECTFDTASFACMAQDEDIFYITDNANADLIRFDATTEKFEQITHGFARPNAEMIFIKSIVQNQKLYLFQNYSDDFYIYDISRDCCLTVKAGVCPPEETHLFCEEHMVSKYYGFWQVEEGICFNYVPDDTMCFVCGQGELTKVSFFDSQDKSALTMQRLLKAPEAGAYLEGWQGDLELFLTHSSPKCERSYSEQNMTIGEHIHQEIMKGKEDGQIRN